MHLIKFALIQFFSAVGLKLWPHVEEHFKRNRILATLFFLVICLILVQILMGCSMVEQRLDPEKFYRRDIQLEINGQKFDGVAVPKKSDSYAIKIKAPGRIDMLTIRSCHREEFFEDPSGGLFSSGKSFTYNYKPIQDLETGKGCLLDIGAFEKIKGRHAWALVDFENEIENIPAIVKCNGEQYNSDPNSVSICQARSGTLQKIKFDHPVKFSQLETRCAVFKSKDQMEFDYIMPEGECVSYFCDKYGNCHRHTYLGYTEILVREVR